MGSNASPPGGCDASRLAHLQPVAELPDCSPTTGKRLDAISEQQMGPVLDRLGFNSPSATSDAYPVSQTPTAPPSAVTEVKAKKRRDRRHIIMPCCTVGDTPVAFSFELVVSPFVIFQPTVFASGDGKLL